MCEINFIKNFNAVQLFIFIKVMNGASIYTKRNGKYPFDDTEDDKSIVFPDKKSQFVLI